MKKYTIYAAVAIIILASSIIASAAIFHGLGGIPSEPSPCKTIIVTDDLGRKIEVPYPAKRVVSLASSISEVICALGSSEVLVAVDKYSLFPPCLQDKVDVGSGSTPNVELILAQEPDVIFTWSYCRVIEELEGQGVPVYVINPASVDDILHEIKAVGQMLGNEESAEKLTEFMVGYIEIVKKRTEGLAEEERPQVYLEGKQAYRTVSNGTFSHDVVTMAGGINIAGKEPIRYPILAAEYIIAENPDVIVKCDYSPTPSQKATEELKEQIADRPGWNQLDAVKNDRVYILHYSELSVNPRLVIGLLKLAKGFHPDLFSDIDTAAVQTHMYKEIYGVDGVVSE